MSDRDEVRGLAREILSLAAPTTHLNYPAQLDDAERRLLTFQSQREAALQAQLHRALGEGARLREALSPFLPPWKDFLRETHDLGDRDPHCPSHEPTVGHYRRGFAALSASPLSERAGAVVRDSLACHDAGLSFSSEDSEELVRKWKDSVAKLSHELSFGGQR